ncbi:uncharacterized protein LOC105771845 [Gossypium raimondii]|uniref:uncharacterized protein LOC105771845 n=1 Tax=Gossypium raimondii TaxID=29730 RepID=UPI00063AABA2|nr:uncharacterized protein LOC105771845 [Gossypium raimondii]
MKVSPVQCVLKKSGITVVSNEKDELIPTRIPTGWLAGRAYYCFLNILGTIKLLFHRRIKRKQLSSVPLILEVFMDDFSVYGNDFNHYAYNLDKKDKDSRDIEECMRRIDSLVEDDFIVGQEAPTIEDEVDVGEEEVRVVVVNKKVEEENTEKESANNIFNASEIVGATADNLE